MRGGGKYGSEMMGSIGAAIDAIAQFGRRPSRRASPARYGAHGQRRPNLGNRPASVPIASGSRSTQDSTPSTTIEAAASAKKFCAVASCVDSHQPPVPMNNSRAVCAITGPITLAAPCDEKYIDDERPMKAYIGAAVDRYCRLAARTLASPVKMIDPDVGENGDEARDRADRDERDEARGPGDPRARAIRSAPIAMPIIGTEAMPTENEIDVSMNSSRAPIP